MKDHDPMEALPLRVVLRKLCCMRISLVQRRAILMLQTRQGRRRALIGTGLFVFFICSAIAVAHLPDADDEARTANRHLRMHSAHNLPAGVHLPSAATGHAPAAAVPTWESQHLPPTPPDAAVDAADAAADAAGNASSDGYANDLRKRAAELNKEIARFKAQENSASKQQRLRRAAEQLDKEIIALKHARQASFTLKQQQPAAASAAAGSRRAAAAASAAQPLPTAAAAAAAAAQQQQQQQPVQAQLRGGIVGGGALRGVRPAGSQPAQPAFGEVDLPSRRQQPSGGVVAASAPSVPSCPRHSEFRIAMVLPWVTEDKSPTRFPAWLPYFVATAGRSAMLVDWLILHEGPLSHAEVPARLTRPPNVKFFDVGHGNIAALIATGMAQQLNLPPANTSSLVTRLRFMFQKWPRLVAEYKPAFGSIFSHYLQNYTHWGYSDLDILLGDVSRFVSRKELTDHHIVTYSFGDADALYLRGQWTVHQNLPNVNTIWKGCEHLGAGLMREVAQKVAWVRRNEAAGRIAYHKRFLSAEGCYSHRAMTTHGIRIKIAQKQFAGLEREQHAGASVYVLHGALWLCARASGFGDAEPDVQTLIKASGQTCDQALPDVQTPLGEPELIEPSGEGCGAWFPAEYRICAEGLKGRSQLNLVRQDGHFYAQRHALAPAITAHDGRCVQGAFFHMQEWKKRWDDGESHVDPTASYDTFRLSQDGIHRL